MSANPRLQPGGPFGLDEAGILEILELARPRGGREDASRLNPGFGFLYYGLVRSLRPDHVAVIGPEFGLGVVCLALALRDNASGTLSFVDTGDGASPETDPDRARAHFERLGVDGVVTHHRMSSARFFGHYDEPELPCIDFALIEGGTPFNQLRQDFINVMRHTRRNAYILLRDADIVRDVSRQSGMRRWLAVLRHDTDCFEIMDFPLSPGVALVRAVRGGPWHPGV